jgi:hypothetical protein
MEPLQMNLQDDLFATPSVNTTEAFLIIAEALVTHFYGDKLQVTLQVTPPEKTSLGNIKLYRGKKLLYKCEGESVEETAALLLYKVLEKEQPKHPKNSNCPICLALKLWLVKEARTSVILKQLQKTISQPSPSEVLEYKHTVNLNPNPKKSDIN